jgi:hypothetical protein
MMQNKYEFLDIESVEEMDNFNDEWVYDLEMEDESHTFIANDILVHNTDSIFVSFKPAMDHCHWRNQIFNEKTLSSIKNKFIILSKEEIKTSNPNFVKWTSSVEELKQSLSLDFSLIIIDGHFVKDRSLNKLIDDDLIPHKIVWNWSTEVDFIQGLDKFRYADYFKDCLDAHAAKYGVLNKEDFELERISESIINIAKKKYIQHIVHEDGIDYERMNYIFPKGVELVRSSTPAFAREKIVDIVKYLFSNPDTFNIKELLKLVKSLRKEFELSNIDDISMQSSCSNYGSKVINDKKLPLRFVNGAHFAVKASAYYNYLLSNNKKYQEKYEFLKSGTKIKYYVCKDKSINDMFAYIRGSYPIEFAPEIDYDEQFRKSILSPINSIIEPLGMPTITKRLSVVMDIFGGF